MRSAGGEAHYFAILLIPIYFAGMQQTNPDSSGVVRFQHITDSKVKCSRLFRKDMTEAESHLWERLRNRKVGNLRFRRQQIIAGYIADFYCEECRLVVEVDGGIHNKPKQAEEDCLRTEVFESRGIRVIRIKNEDVLADASRVVKKILDFRKKS